MLVSRRLYWRKLIIMTSQGNITRIYVSTFGKKCYQLRKHEIPIEVGSTGRNNQIYSTCDNTGDNIAYENPYMGELTGIYWIWKNDKSLKDDDIIGFRHYNKKFFLMTKHKIEKLIWNKGYDFIVRGSRIMGPHADYEQYHLFEEVLAEYDPPLWKTYCSMYERDGRGGGSGANMFITRKKDFDKYCAYIFPLFAKVREAIGEPCGDLASPYHERYCAFFGERLLRPYLIHNNYKLYDCRMQPVGSIPFMLFTFVYQTLRRIVPAPLHNLLPKKLRTKLYDIQRRSSYR